MTLTEKKQYLSQYRLQQVKINRITKMLEYFPDQKDKLKQQLAEARELRNRIESEIESMDDPALIEILSQKYMCGHTLADISLIMNYSLRHIERLHRKALMCFGKS